MCLVPAALLVSGPARAGESAAPPSGGSPGSLSLAYERGAGTERCPDDRGVRDLLAEGRAGALLRVHLAVRARRPPSGSRAAEGQSRERDDDPARGDLEGRIELFDAEGRRVWESEQSSGESDCRTLIASLVLSLRVAESALSLPGSGSERPPSEPPIHVWGVTWPPAPLLPGPAVLPMLRTDDRSPADVAREAALPDYPAFRASAATAVAIGMTPAATARFALGVGLVWPGLSLSIEARNVAPSTGHFRGHTLEATRWEGSLVPCAGRGVVFACGLFTFGGLWTHLTGAHHDSGGYFHAGAGVRVGVDMEVSSNLGVATYCDVEGSFFSNHVRMDRFSMWVEAPVQVAFSFAITGVFPQARQ